MVSGETVLSGAPHPGTALRVLRTPAGWYVGFNTEGGAPYSRESAYFSSEAEAREFLLHLRTMSEGTICEVCGGNGFVRVKHEIFADQWETDQCHACCSSGEVRV